MYKYFPVLPATGETIQDISYLRIREASAWRISVLLATGEHYYDIKYFMHDFMYTFRSRIELMKISKKVFWLKRQNSKISKPQIPKTPKLQNPKTFQNLNSASKNDQKLLTLREARLVC